MQKNNDFIQESLSQGSCIKFNNISFGWSISLEEIEKKFQSLPINLKQVHGKDILEVSQIRGQSTGDGLYSKNKDKLLIIRTADCIPLFFFSLQTKIYGILHVGWRGFQKGIILSLKEKIKFDNTYIFYLGPGISQQNYEVGEDLKENFPKQIQKELFLSISSNKYLFNLKKGIEKELQNLGQVQIFNANICTYENNNLPSYRRDKTEKRIFNFIIST